MKTNTNIANIFGTKAITETYNPAVVLATKLPVTEEYKLYTVVSIEDAKINAHGDVKMYMVIQNADGAYKVNIKIGKTVDGRVEPIYANLEHIMRQLGDTPDSRTFQDLYTKAMELPGKNIWVKGNKFTVTSQVTGETSEGIYYTYDHTGK